MNLLALSVALAGGLASTANAQEPVWDANTVVLESQKLADGVFAVVQQGAKEMAAKGLPLATSSGFVVGHDSVLVIDTMLNEKSNAQLFDLIKAETDLPVRYAVNTSFHGDHSYGNQYLPKETLIIQHENTAAYIHSHLDADKAFMMQNFGAGRGIEQVVATDADILVSKGGSLTINLGGVSVDIKDYGFAQTGGDLFVSVPEADVLWAGNPVIAQAPALPWLLDGHLVQTRDTLQSVLGSFDAQTKVVPGHGPVTNIGAIQFAVDYLTAVETEVTAAISEGLSLEDTVARLCCANQLTNGSPLSPDGFTPRLS
jgi:glyoxylase-like metal-dependent hydrolase (beta-lactamase superfamily II)